MTTQQQEQRPDLSQEHRSRRPLWMRWLIASIILLFIAVGTVIWILTSRGSFTTILPIVIFTVLGVLIGLFQWLFPVSSSSSLHPFAHLHTHQILENTSVVQEVQPIMVHVSTTQPLSSSTPLAEQASYRGLVGSPPPVDPRTIQQREQVVKEVYSQLTQANITAIALTGMGGEGKSTLAALIYRYTEVQRLTGTSPFLAGTLWFTVDPAVTFSDLAGNLFEALGKPLPELGNLAPQNQAVALFNALNTSNNPRLIILDQFENLLNWDTSHALTDRPGVGEWLDILNSQPCACRILLTSRSRPVGTREYPQTYLQEYIVRSLEVNEGVALLGSQGVQGTEKELQNAVSHCARHAFSLTLLATLMRNHHLDLNTVLKDKTLWIGDIATNLLDQIFMQQLNEVQKELLLVFSVYREPVPVEAALMIVTKASKTQIPSALKTLVTQHLVEGVGEGRYQLHNIVAEYAWRQFDMNSWQENEEALRATHIKAANYYLQRAATTCPPREKRSKVRDVHDLIEVVWHYCQAELWQEAYNLMMSERMFSDLYHWGGNALLIDFCSLFLRSGKQFIDSFKEMFIYRKLASAYNILGRKDQALEYFQKALRLSEDLGDRKGEGRTIISLGNVYTSLGQMEEACKRYEKGLELCRKINYPVGQGMALNGLGWVHRNLKKTEEALKYFELALVMRREIKNRDGEGETLNGLGLVYSDLGKKEDALRYFEEALEIRKEIGNIGGEAGTLNNLGLTYFELGERERAITFFEQSLRIRREIGDRLGEGKVTLNMGKLYFEKENYDVALAFFLVSESILDTMKVPDGVALQREIKKLSRAIGEHDFATLKATVKPQAQQIVDQTLHNMMS